MAPKIAPSNSIFQIVVADTLRSDIGQQDNNVKGYPEFVSDQKLYQTIIVGYALDPWYSNPHNLKHFVYENHIWWYDKAVVVPDVSFQGSNIRSFLLREYHDAMYSGHVGVTKTYKRVRVNFWWPEMQGSIRSYIKSCEICQRSKAPTLKPVGLLQPLEIPDSNWEVVSIDFISGLTPSTNGYDAIFVCVDKLSKMAHFMPTTTHVTAEGTARLFRDHVYKIHGLPKVILSDRDARFTSRFWDALHGLLGTRLAMSTAFHPQTDGQTEWVNRILEDMLRHYVNPVQDDWDEFLALVEFAYNNSWQESVRNTPFVLNYG